MSPFVSLTLGPVIVFNTMLLPDVPECNGIPPALAFDTPVTLLLINSLILLAV